ncbi:DNA-binding protein [Bacteroides helcogenes]|nr:DNA-binding protein [Bacteroides helcogenes]MDY5237237.1 DNA-binding protein [Bacteroides helcogenes]
MGNKFISSFPNINIATSVSVADIDFDKLCDQVTSQDFVPRGIVKAVLDGMIDVLCTYASIGTTIRLGDFGSIRPGLNSRSQDTAKAVTADVVYRQKLIFVPGMRLKNMMKTSGVTRVTIESALSYLSSPPRP